MSLKLCTCTLLCLGCIQHLGMECKCSLHVLPSLHYVRSVRIRSFSGPYFPVFGLNTGRYGVSLRIQSECGKIPTRKTSNTDAFHVVLISNFLMKCSLIRAFPNTF